MIREELGVCFIGAFSKLLDGGEIREWDAGDLSRRHRLDLGRFSLHLTAHRGGLGESWNLDGTLKTRVGDGWYFD